MGDCKWIRQRFGFESHQKRWAFQPEKLPVCHAEGKLPGETNKYACKNRRAYKVRNGMGIGKRNQAAHFVDADQSGLARAQFVDAGRAVEGVNGHGDIYHRFLAKHPQNGRFATRGNMPGFLAECLIINGLCLAARTGLEPVHRP